MHAALLAELERRGPTIVVLEDVHRADEATPPDVAPARLPDRGDRASSSPAIGTTSPRDPSPAQCRALSGQAGALSGSSLSPCRMQP